MQITAKIPSGKDIPLNVDTTDTIGILKAKIAAKEKLPADKLVLIFAGKILTDDETVEGCRIEKESCIHVVQRAVGQVAPTGQRNDITAVANKIYDIKVSEDNDSKDESPPGYDEKKQDPSAQIFIKSFDGKTVTLNIDDFEKTVNALKVQFYEKEGIEVQYQSLVYAGKPLRDEKTLNDYGIRKGSTLHLVGRVPGG